MASEDAIQMLMSVVGGITREQAQALLNVRFHFAEIHFQICLHFGSRETTMISTKLSTCITKILKVPYNQL